MQKCDEARRWPDSLSDIPDANLEEFLTHAESCPYHEELLRMEERPFIAPARLARSLTSDGRIPSTPEDRSQIEKNHRRHQQWKKTKAHVQSLSLRYRGEEVARHERFLGLDTRVIRELDAPGDLQIWKLTDDASGEEAPLGVYLVEGFSHKGKPEVLELANGQKVMVSVKHMVGSKYEIEFACGEPEDFNQIIEELEEPLTKSDEESLGHQAGSSNGFFGSSGQPTAARQQLLSALPPRAAFATVATLLIFCISIVVLGVRIGAVCGKSLPSSASAQTEEDVRTSRNPPESQADLSQMAVKTGSNEDGVSVSVSFKPGQPLRRTRPVGNRQNHTNRSQQK